MQVASSNATVRYVLTSYHPAGIDAGGVLRHPNQALVVNYTLRYERFLISSSECSNVLVQVVVCGVLDSRPVCLLVSACQEVGGEQAKSPPGGCSSRFTRGLATPCRLFSFANGDGACQWKRCEEDDESDGVGLGTW